MRLILGCKGLYLMNKINKALLENNIDFIKDFICNNPSWLVKPLLLKKDYPALPIHYAVHYDYIELVRLFLEKKPALLNKPGNEKLTPLMTACARGHIEIVQYLISQKADLFCKIYNPENQGIHGNTAFHFAIRKEHFDIADLLLSAMIDHFGAKEVAEFLVMSMDEIMDFVDAKPERVDFFKESFKFEQTALFYNKKTHRRASCVLEINSTNQEWSFFKPIRSLGEGGIGQVRLFENDNNRAFAVKSPQEEYIDLSEESFNHMKDAVVSEASFNSRAYPNEPCEVRVFCDEQDGRYTSSYRYITAYVQGEEAKKMMPTINDAGELINVILQIALEVQRIHELGIIHGDLNPRNIMITNNNKVRLIDFGQTYDLCADTAKCYPSGNKMWWMAPELCDDGKEDVKPNENQDVYALGKTLEKLLKKTACYATAKEKFPCIESFIKQAQCINPTERPSLKAFCEKLDDEIFLFIDLEESEDCTSSETRVSSAMSGSSSFENTDIKCDELEFFSPMKTSYIQ